MSSARFLSSRFVDAATLVASSELSSLPVANLQNMRPDKVHRMTGCTAEYVTVDFGSDVAADMLALAAHNLSATATLRWRMAATAADVTASPAVDTTALSAWPSSGKHSDPDWPSEFSLLTWTNSTGYRYGRLDIADASNAAGYIEAGRLFCGPSFVPTINVDLDVGLGLAPVGSVRWSEFGQVFTGDRGPGHRVLTVPMSSITETEMTDDLFELQRYCGVARDFAFCLDPAATTKFHKLSMQARFSALPAFQAQRFWNDADQIWQIALTLDEVL